jgi:hypothetical protein
MKMRLINANKYCEFLNNYPLKKAQDNVMNCYRDALRYTFECEVDAVPVRHGHWIDINGDGSLWRCSVCGELQCCESNYCGDCGAKMDEVEE